MEYQEIIIDWEAKKPINDFIESEIEKRDVLYQIYGNHHIYGRDTLLYIGISTNFKNRIRSHLEGIFGPVNNLSISIGRIGNYKGRLEIPESILIANHKPSHNKEYIHYLDEEAMKNKIIIINNGDNGMLKTCCTNFWWL